MLILKHAGHRIEDRIELDNLLSHLGETTSRIEGVTLKDIYFVKGKEGFVLFLECESEQKYLEWREICPPPPEADDWYEILFNKDEYLSRL